MVVRFCVMGDIWVSFFMDCLFISRLVGKGIFMTGMKVMNVLIVVVVGVVSASDVSTNHNGEPHRALCDVMHAAAAKWKKIKNFDSPLKKALEKTIFGKHGGNVITPSELQMPGDYKKPENEDTKNTRKNWCGSCETEGQKHYSGESATHDLVCLCVPGQNMWPMKSQEETLCGKSKEAWTKDGDKEGWYTNIISEKDLKTQHLTATWGTIVKECLKEDGGKDLEAALKNFKDNLRQKNGNQYLGNHTDDYDCGGAYGYSLCVKYTQQCEKNSWWKKLEDAIKKDKEEMEKKNADGKKTESLENGQKLKVSNGPQTDPEKSSQNPQPISRVSQSPQTEEHEDPPRAEQVISNINATIEEDSSTIICPFWLLLVFLYN
ncbi:Variant surface glycoprotein [Trypanosoma congolense IL3000]|uniref:Variant surface glycoprotein n=1 Tax=Trypanosoma congolense (strain IL3000) TaxID=1068625 RepID=F9WGZ9_TRYCI|nr:Variant surface glycoprotein [Trypanosoma congolense IL3000]